MIFIKHCKDRQIESNIVYKKARNYLPNYNLLIDYLLNNQHLFHIRQVNDLFIYNA